MARRSTCRCWIRSNVEREQGTVQLFAREAVEVTTNEDDLESALPDALGAAGRERSNLRASCVHPSAGPHSDHRHSQADTPVGPGRNRRRRSTGPYAGNNQCRFLVEYAGLDTFRIDVPEAAMPTLQIEAVAS